MVQMESVTAVVQQGISEVKTDAGLCDILQTKGLIEENSQRSNL